MGSRVLAVDGHEVVGEATDLAEAVRILLYSADSAVRGLAAYAGADGFVLKGAPLAELNDLLGP